MNTNDETRNRTQLAEEVRRLTNDNVMLRTQLAQARATIADYERCNVVADSIDGVRLETVSDKTRAHQCNAVAVEVDTEFGEYMFDHGTMWYPQRNRRNRYTREQQIAAAIEAWKAQAANADLRRYALSLERRLNAGGDSGGVEKT